MSVIATRVLAQHLVFTQPDGYLTCSCDNHDFVFDTDEFVHHIASATENEVRRTKTDIDVAVDRIYNAWTKPGRRADVHYAILDRVRKEWPTITNAVEALVHAVDARRKQL